MLNLIVLFFMEMCTSLFLRMLFPSINLQILTVIYIGINSLLMLIYFYRHIKNLSVCLALQLGYLLRIGLLCLDLYGRKYIILPNSGSDSEVYYHKAIKIAQDLELVIKGNYDVFSKIMGVIAHFFGDERTIIQYFNVLLGMATIIVIYKIMNVINIKGSIITIVTVIISVLPNFAIMSSIFLREAIISFLITASFYYFIRWYNKNKLNELLKAIILILIGMSMHAGILGILLGYLISYIIYNPRKKKIVIDARTIVTLVGSIIIFMIISNILGDSIFGKFKNIETIEDVGSHIVKYSKGGSEYLANLVPTNIGQAILYLPIRSLYFIASPMPWDIRGINDIIAFMFSSLYYMIAITLGIKSVKKSNQNKELIICMLCILGATIIIFAFGTSNAGTAMRHREKLIGVVTILLALALNMKNKRFKTNN